MQTIPDDLLDRIIAAKPGYAPQVACIRAHPERAHEYERVLAWEFLGGVTPPSITPVEVHFLAAASAGHPYGSWIDLDYAASLSGFDRSHLWRLATSGQLPALKWRSEWYVDREAAQTLTRQPAGRRRQADDPERRQQP